MPIGNFLRFALDFFKIPKEVDTQTNIIMSLGCLQTNLYLVNSTTHRAINASCSWTNILLAFPTTVMNLLLLTALATSRDKRRPCNILLLNLAITDVLTGLINMPGYFLVFRFMADGKDSCNYAKIILPISFGLNCASFTITTLIAIERYIKVFRPFLHSAHMTLRNVTVFIATTWIVSISFGIALVAGVSSSKRNAVLGTLIIIGLALNLFCYVRILWRARKIRLQIESEVARFGQSNISSLGMRYAFLGGLITLSIVICFTPTIICRLLRSLGYLSDILRDIGCLEYTLTAINSIINPIITCRFCPSAREKVLKILTCRMCCNKATE